VPISATEIQQEIVGFLDQTRPVDGFIAVQVADLAQRDGTIEGEVFLSRRFGGEVGDADLERVRSVVDRAFSDGEIVLPGVRSVELHQVEAGFFNERVHPQLGTVRTLASWLVVTPE
jgi:hypothetical protein